MVSFQSPPVLLTVVHPSGVRWIIHDASLADRICLPKTTPVPICLDELVSTVPSSCDSGCERFYTGSSAGNSERKRKKKIIGRRNGSSANPLVAPTDEWKKRKLVAMPPLM